MAGNFTNFVANAAEQTKKNFLQNVLLPQDKKTYNSYNQSSDEGNLSDDNFVSSSQISLKAPEINKSHQSFSSRIQSSSAIGEVKPITFTSSPTTTGVKQLDQVFNTLQDQIVDGLNDVQDNIITNLNKVIKKQKTQDTDLQYLKDQTRKIKTLVKSNDENISRLYKKLNERTVPPRDSQGRFISKTGLMDDDSSNQDKEKDNSNNLNLSSILKNTAKGAGALAFLKGAGVRLAPLAAGAATHYLDMDDSLPGRSSIGHFINKNIPGAARIDELSYDFFKKIGVNGVLEPYGLGIGTKDATKFYNNNLSDDLLGIANPVQLAGKSLGKMIGNKLFNKSESSDSDFNNQRPPANNDNEQKSDISLKSKETIDIKSLNSINMETRSLSIKSKDFTLDIDNLNLSYSAKRAFQNILGEVGNKEESDNNQSNHSLPETKLSPKNEILYNEDIQKYGRDKANQLADIRENPLTWGARNIYSNMTGADPSQAAAQAIGSDYSTTSKSIGKASTKPNDRKVDDMSNEDREKAKSMSSSALDNLLKIQGLNQYKDREAIRQYLKDGGVNMDPSTTAWCAATVNATLNKAGIKGTGSNIATSFLNWGSQVTDPSKIQKGDVLVESRGRKAFETGGHVMMATGNTRTDDNGNLQIEAIGGNTSKGVNKRWYSPNQISIRRSDQTTFSDQLQPQDQQSIQNDAQKNQNTNQTDIFNREKQFGQMFKDNPELKDKMFAVALQEVGSKSESSQRAIMETMMNRSQSRDIPMDKILTPGYYAGFRGVPQGYQQLKDPKIREQLERAYQAVLKGSNDSNFATDNASAGVAARAMQTSTFTKKTESGESLFRKDQSPEIHGSGVVQKDRKWFDRVSSPNVESKVQPSSNNNDFPPVAELNDNTTKSLSEQAGIKDIPDATPVEKPVQPSLAEQAGIKDIPDATPVEKPVESKVQPSSNNNDFPPVAGTELDDAPQRGNQSQSSSSEEKSSSSSSQQSSISNPVNTIGDKGPEPGSDGYGQQKQNADNSGGICAL